MIRKDMDDRCLNKDILLVGMSGKRSSMWSIRSDSQNTWSKNPSYCYCTCTNPPKQTNVYRF